jgi:hypothetical protein
LRNFQTSAGNRSIPLRLLKAGLERGIDRMALS